MDKHVKNVKVSADIHQQLRVQAALAGVTISEYADILLIVGMAELADASFANEVDALKKVFYDRLAQRD